MENGKQSAFPLDGNHIGHPDTIGLTKREYFAGLAMQGLLANENGFIVSTTEKTSESAINKAKFCVIMADELLKQLEKSE